MGYGSEQTLFILYAMQYITYCLDSWLFFYLQYNNKEEQQMVVFHSEICLPYKVWLRLA